VTRGWQRAPHLNAAAFSSSALAASVARCCSGPRRRGPMMSKRLRDSSRMTPWHLPGTAFSRWPGNGLRAQTGRRTGPCDWHPGYPPKHRTGTCCPRCRLSHAYSPDGDRGCVGANRRGHDPLPLRDRERQLPTRPIRADELPLFGGARCFGCRLRRLFPLRHPRGRSRRRRRGISGPPRLGWPRRVAWRSLQSERGVCRVGGRICRHGNLGFARASQSSR